MEASFACEEGRREDGGQGLSYSDSAKSALDCPNVIFAGKARAGVKEGHLVRFADHQAPWEAWSQVVCARLAVLKRVDVAECELAAFVDIPDLPSAQLERARLRRGKPETLEAPMPIPIAPVSVQPLGQVFSLSLYILECDSAHGAWCRKKE